MRYPGRRQRGRTLLAAGALLLAFASTTRADQLRGANLHPLWADSPQSTYDQEFAMLQSAGANSVRIDVMWQSLEWTGRGNFDAATVAQLDSIFHDAQSYGLKVIVTLWATPCWASSAPPDVSQGCSGDWWNGTVNRYPPTDPAAYAEAAAYIAQRWGAQMAALEVWNEPDSGQFWVSSNPAGDYATLVKATYPAVKAVAPNLPVLMTLAGTSSSFLSQLYANGVQGNYDGIGVHPYGDQDFAGLKALRAYEQSQGDSSPLWVTEFGASSNVVSAQEQADTVQQGLRELAALPYVAAVEVYEMRDQGTDTTDPESGFGLFDSSQNPKPAWNAFVSALSDINAAQTVNQTAPTIFGTATDGQTLTLTQGSWSGQPTLTDVWQSCDQYGTCTDIATGSSYLVQDSDVGNTIRIKETAAGGSATDGVVALSAPTATVNAVAPVNIDPPAIYGTAVVGQTVWANAGDWSGIPAPWTYDAWLSCAPGGSCATVGSGNSYTLQASDAGNTIQLREYAGNLATTAGNYPTAMSSPTDPVAAEAPTNSSPPAISGTATDGQTLTVTQGTWSGSPTLADSWQSCDSSGSCASVGGGTSYTLADSDVGNTIQVVETATAPGPSGQTATVTSTSTAAVAPSSPRSVTPPTIAGTPIVGRTLRLGRGTWSGTAPIQISDSWQSCPPAGSCATVGTGSTYQLQASDLGHTIQIVESAANVATSANGAIAPPSVSSLATALVAPAPPLNLGLPVISGTPTDGQVLTVVPGRWGGSPPLARSYAWQSCDQLGNCATVGNGGRYVIRSGDVAHAIVVVETASNPATAPATILPAPSVRSLATATVAPVAPQNVAAPAVSGSPVVGQALTVVLGSWRGTTPMTRSEVWQSCDSSGNCVKVGSGARYVVRKTDVGHTIVVVETVGNAATAPTTPAPAPTVSAKPTVAVTAATGATH